MSMTDFERAMTDIASSTSWSVLVEGAHRAVTALGAAACSVGWLEDEVVRQAARGFDTRLETRYALIPVMAALPGPEALRTRSTQVLEDRSATLDRYPAAAPILAGTALEAAACLPMLVDDLAVGYLAAHYRGPHHFDQAELLLLRVAAAGCAGVLSRLEP